MFAQCLLNLFQAAQAPQEVEQVVKMTTTTSASIQPQTAPCASPQKQLPIMFSEKTTEQQQSQQQSQQQQQQDVVGDDEKVADVVANRRKPETDIVVLCTSDPGRFIKRKQTDTETANESRESLYQETQPDSMNAESPASSVSSFSNQTDNNSSARLKQPTVVLQPLDLGGRASIRLQSLEEERLKEENVAVPSGSYKPDNEANVNSTHTQSERKQHRSPSEVEASGQVFLTASPRKRPKISTSSEPEPVQCYSETSKSDKELMPVTVADPRDTEEKSVSPKERSRSQGTENVSTVTQQHQDSPSSGSSSKGKYESSKGRTKQKSADLEAHSPEKPGLKLLIRSKPSSTTSEFTSSVVDPYKFDDSEEGASCSGDTRSQKRKMNEDNDSESDGSHGSGDQVKDTKDRQSPKKLKLPR